MTVSLIKRKLSFTPWFKRRIQYRKSTSLGLYFAAQNMQLAFFVWLIAHIKGQIFADVVFVQLLDFGMFHS